MNTQLTLSTDTHGRVTVSTLLNQAVSNNPAGMCVVKADRRLLYANHAAEQLLRLKRNPNNSQEWFVQPEMEGLWRGPDGLFQRILRTREPALDPSQTVHWSEDDYIVLCVHATPLLDEQRAVLGAAFYFFDVSGPTLRSLRALKLQLDQEHQNHLKSLSQIANNMAQTFNTLLASIIGESETALESINTQTPAHGHVRRVLRSAYKAAGVSKQLLTYSAKSNPSTSHKQPSELLFSFKDQLQGLLRPGTELVWELAADVPQVAVNESQLKQALSNLVMNSVQALPRPQGGGIRIRTCAQFLDADSLRNIPQRSASASPGRYVIIEVADEGQGVEPSVQKRMFDPFFSTRPPQNGMGLPTVAGVARAHGGFVAVDSQPGQGTTMRMGLPVHSSPASEAPASKRVTQANGPRSMRVGVLVVDDEPTVRNVAAMLLARASATTFVAGDGEAALRLYEAERERIDVALVDMTMPGMPGVEVMSRLRACNADLPIVLMSGFTTDQIEHPDAITQFLPKPFSREQMFNSLRAVLERHQRPAGC